MHLSGRPVAAFDPEGLIFAAGVNSESVKLYDLRSFDKVFSRHECGQFYECFFYHMVSFECSTMWSLVVAWHLIKLISTQ